MPEPYAIGILGLGVMGQRMLDRLHGHPRFQPLCAWDPDPAIREATRARHDWLQVPEAPEALLERPGLRGVYIASPPQSHLGWAERAFARGLTVLCEKPLSVNADDAARTLQRQRQGQHRAAVNFSLASSSGLAQLQSCFGVASRHPMGELQSVQLKLRFAQWPRPWQKGAGAWLCGRAEGGFSREVLSHFIFVLQRVLGAAEVVHSEPVYPAHPDASEIGLRARLFAAGVPVDIDAAVLGQEADVNEMRWRARGGEVVLSDWFRCIRLRKDEDWHELSDKDLRPDLAEADLLEHWGALLDGRSHALPGFAEALAVQQTIEALLRPVGQARVPGAARQVETMGEAGR